MTTFDWNSLEAQVIDIPGARRGFQGAPQKRFAAALRREAKKRDKWITIRICASQDAAIVRIRTF